MILILSVCLAEIHLDIDDPLFLHVGKIALKRLHVIGKLFRDLCPGNRNDIIYGSVIYQILLDKFYGRFLVIRHVMMPDDVIMLVFFLIERIRRTYLVEIEGIDRKLFVGYG